MTWCAALSEGAIAASSAAALSRRGSGEGEDVGVCAVASGAAKAPAASPIDTSRRDIRIRTSLTPVPTLMAPGREEKGCCGLVSESGERETAFGAMLATKEKLMAYRVRGLAPELFDPLFDLSDAELRARHIERVVVDAKPSAPCRVSLDDAEIGETVLLLNFEHQPAETPYRQQGPIFVRRGQHAFAGDDLGPAMKLRPLSLRAFDAQGMMVDADIAQGDAVPGLIERFFANPDVAYIHAHYAKRGCFAARIDRA